MIEYWIEALVIVAVLLFILGLFNKVDEPVTEENVDVSVVADSNGLDLDLAPIKPVYVSESQDNDRLLVDFEGNWHTKSTGMAHHATTLGMYIHT